MQSLPSSQGIKRPSENSDCNNQGRPHKKEKKHAYDHNGHWTDAEHKRFLDGIRRYGKQWRLVRDRVKTRTVTQVRTHAQKYFAKMTKQAETRMNRGEIIKSSMVRGVYIHPNAKPRRRSIHTIANTIQQIGSRNEGSPKGTLLDYLLEAIDASKKCKDNDNEKNMIQIFFKSPFYASVRMESESLVEGLMHRIDKSMDTILTSNPLISTKESILMKRFENVGELVRSIKTAISVVPNLFLQQELSHHLDSEVARLAKLHFLNPVHPLTTTVLSENDGSKPTSIVSDGQSTPLGRKLPSFASLIPLSRFK